MRIITNPGANLTKEEIDRYGIILTPQQIVADGVTFGTIGMSSIADVDRVIASSKTFPHTLGTSAAELVSLYHEIGTRDREIIVVTNSRNFIGTHDAAVAAARTLQTLPAFREVKIAVIDSMVSDLGAGLITLFCAESARQGRTFAEIVEVARRLTSVSRMVFIPTEIDFLLKSGRASFLKSMAATLLQKLPIVVTRDGEMKSGGSISKSANLGQVAADKLIAAFPAVRKIMLGVVHGKQESAAADLKMLLEARYNVCVSIQRPLSPGVYLNSGPGVGAYIIPMDASPWPLELDRVT